MAEEFDVAQPADASALDRLSMRDENGEIRPEFVREIAQRFMTPTRRCCAPSWRNFMRPISAI